MQRYQKFLAALTLTGCLAGCASDATTPDKKGAAGDATFFMGARLIPGDGSPAIEESTFIVEGGKFKSIGKKNEVKPPQGAARVDLTGQTIMPTIYNLHGHPGLNNGASFGPQNYNRDSVMADLYRYAYYGVNAVASLGGDAGDIAFEIRDQQRAGKLDGAQLYTAGRGITVKGGWPVPILKDIPIQVSNESEARKAVDDDANKKVDFIKIWVDDNMGTVPKMKPEIYRAVIDEAHKKNLRVVAHVFELADAKDLVNSGVDGLVHSIRDKEVDDDLISAMKQKNVFFTPTLTAHESKFVYADKPSWLGEQAMREVYPASLSAFLEDPVTVGKFNRNPDLPKFREQYAMAQKNLKKMAQAGVRIGLGTDSGVANTYPGYFEHREMELMVNAGMSPMDAIKAATSVSADVLAIKDSGVLAVGKNADFMVLTANPLDKITNTKELFTIYKNGSEVDRSGMIRNATMNVPRVTEKDREAERAAEAKDAQEKADAKLPHFGKYPLGQAVMIRAMAIPTPKYSTATHQQGPPDKITVTMAGASASDYREFYSQALSKYSWKAAGDCWDRKHPINNKTETLCLSPSGKSVVLQITEK